MKLLFRIGYNTAWGKAYIFWAVLRNWANGMSPSR